MSRNKIAEELSLDAKMIELSMGMSNDYEQAVTLNITHFILLHATNRFLSFLLVCHSTTKRLWWEVLMCELVAWFLDRERKNNNLLNKIYI
jgi:hypothetical protein